MKTKKLNSPSLKDSGVTLTMQVNPGQLDHLDLGKVLASLNLKSLSLVWVLNASGRTLPYTQLDSTNSTQSHNLAISGPFAQVEKARHHIRGIVPAEISVSCRADRVDILGQQLLFAHFWNSFGVRTSFNLIQEDSSYEVSLKGHCGHVERLKEAIHYFCHILQTPAESVEVQVKTSKEHLELVSNQTELISARSGARIRCFHDEEDSENVILIRGCMDSTYTARDMIYGLAPIQLKFSAKSENIVEKMFDTAKQMDIVVTCVDTGPGTMDITLWTYEWNIAKLYELKKMCQGVKRGRALKLNLSNIWEDLAETRSSFLFAACKMGLGGAAKEEAQMETESPFMTPRSMSPVVPTEFTRNDDSSSDTEGFMSDATVLADNDASPNHDPDSTFTEDELHQILAKNKLSHFFKLFHEKGIDAQSFANLKEKDLIEFGVASKRARMTLLSAITRSL